MLEQKEYAAQGLKNWAAITFNDNQKCLDLIEGVRALSLSLLYVRVRVSVRLIADRSVVTHHLHQAAPPGILQLLDEEARFPKGSDDSFLTKVVNNHKKNMHFETPRLRGRSPSFIVRHYAGDVRSYIVRFAASRQSTDRSVCLLSRCNGTGDVPGTWVP
jgi:myosin heavy subunit